MLSPSVGRPSHPVDVPRPIRNTPVPLPWFFPSGSVFARTHETVRKFLHHDTRCFPTPPVVLFRGLALYPLPPRGPRRPGMHYRHYHEFPQLLRLCCTATKMAAGCILPCEEDALLVCSSFYCGACAAGMSCYVIPLDN